MDKTYKPGMILLMTLLILSTSSCTKLPKETDEGKNTLGFLVDGNKFIASGLDGQDFYASYMRSDKLLTVQGYKQGTQDGVYINYSNFQLSEGKFDINMPTKWANYDVGTTYSSYEGYLQITFLDSLSKPKIISGTFEFNAKSSTREVKRITQGRFDLQLSIYP